MRIAAASLSLLLLTGCVFMPSYRFVSSGQSVDDASIFAQILRGDSLKPLAPVHLRGVRNAAGDLLIEWTRRERLPLPLRDNAGTPLSEEELVFWVDVYNGSTLVHSYRVKPALAQPILWKVFSDPQSRLTISTDGTIVAAPAASIVNGDAIAVGLQSFGGGNDGMIEYDVSASALPTQFGLAIEPLRDPSAPYDSDNSPFFWALNTFNGRDSYPASGWYDSVLGYTSHNGSTYNIDDNDSLAIRRAGDRFDYFINFQGDPSVPVFTSQHFMSDNYRPFIYFSANDTVTTKKALRCRIRYRTHSFLYTAAQQTIDFGSAQSSVKIRVAQESAIVGRGFYLESNL